MGRSLNPPLPAATWREFAVALTLLRGGPGTLLARVFKELTERQPALPDELLSTRISDRLKIPGGERARRWSEALELARAHLQKSAMSGMDLSTTRDDTYPPLLRHIVDPPVLLWTKGVQQILARPAIAIVGSRAATPVALAIGRRLASELAEQGIVIVSGLARGVDGAAHQGALDAGGQTIAVLGSGADIIYPREHVDLASRLLTSGVLVSEYPPGTPSYAGHFPQRNRIISGVARAVVVVEASEKSGSLITARLALDQGREVLAVPGNVLSGRNRGCHALIRDGAGIVESADDVLNQLGWVRSRPSPKANGTNSLHLKGLEETMAAGEPYSVEDLAGKTGLSVPDVLAELGRLELAGRIVREAGGRYLRLD